MIKVSLNKATLRSLRIKNVRGYSPWRSSITQNIIANQVTKGTSGVTLWEMGWVWTQQETLVVVPQPTAALTSPLIWLHPRWIKKLTAALWWYKIPCLMPTLFTSKTKTKIRYQTLMSLCFTINYQKPSRHQTISSLECCILKKDLIQGSKQLSNLEWTDPSCHWKILWVRRASLTRRSGRWFRNKIEDTRTYCIKSLLLVTIWCVFRTMCQVPIGTGSSKKPKMS